jgi:hypothetical protein
MADKEKYPIGTRVIFIANKNMCYEAKQDDGKIGKIVGESAFTGNAQVFIPDSAKSYGKHKTWYTNWANIKPLRIKGEQLEFEFMD